MSEGLSSDVSASAPKYLVDLIKTYQGLLLPEVCREITARFDESADLQSHSVSPGYRFTEIDVSQHWADVHDLLFPMFSEVVRLYAEETRALGYWPRHGLERIRMKRYLPGAGEAFLPHLDVHDYPSARRFLAMFAYLVDVEEGGETAFPHWGVEIKPRLGTVLAFPPTMPFLHEGRAPISGPKYLIGTYCHYL